jgi:RNA polymerase sigma-70 factor (ECF subfamily)
LQGLTAALENPTLGPLDLALGEERRQHVRAAVDRLPEFLRQVVILAYYQGLKYREVADILRIPVGTVKSRLHAALQKLQESWAASPSAQDLLSLG